MDGGHASIAGQNTARQWHVLRKHLILVQESKNVKCHDVLESYISFVSYTYIYTYVHLKCTYVSNVLMQKK